MTSHQSIIAHYTRRAEAVAARIRQLRRRGQAFVLAEIALFLLAVGFLALYALQAQHWGALAGALVSLLAYILVRWTDARNDRTRHEAEQLHEAYLHELKYHEGDFSAFDPGQNYVDSQHPYSFDLDLFGKESFFQRINRTVTRKGSDILAQWLTQIPAQAADIGRRQAAVEQLAQQEDLRAHFMACREEEPADTYELLDVTHKISKLRLPVRATGTGVLVLFLLVLLSFYVEVVLSFMGHLHYSVPVGQGLILFCGVQALTSRPLKEITRLTDRLTKLFLVYSRLFRLSASLKHPAGEGLLSSIAAQCRDMEDAMTGLYSQSSTFDSRGNAFYLFLADTFAMNGIVVLRRFRKWQKRYGAGLAQGIDALSTLDALVSMATFRYNEPQTCWPEIITGDPGISFEGRNMRHPFLGMKAVGNDFDINNDNFYIVTGANMAGKSTFLRTVGLSYVMATAGLPVMADSLRVSRFHLFTSMRTQDDLSQGISYFNAELRRLQQLIHFVNDTHGHTLIILDEILKGTNSADKLNGSRMFLDYISHKAVAGIIATHDLELSKMETEHPDRFHNFCFEIKLGTQVTYSYKIAPGVAKNQNATFLLKTLLK